MMKSQSSTCRLHRSQGCISSKACYALASYAFRTPLLLNRTPYETEQAYYLLLLLIVVSRKSSAIRFPNVHLDKEFRAVSWAGIDRSYGGIEIVVELIDTRWGYL